MADVVVHPDPAAAHIAYLAGVTAIAELVEDRIGTLMPSRDAPTRWPAVRVTTIDAPVVQDRRWVRALMQFDCWAARQLAANNLGALVAAHLTEATGTVVLAGTTVLGGPEAGTVTVRPDPDRSLTPPQPRTIVTAQLWVRPNP